MATLVELVQEGTNNKTDQETKTLDDGADAGMQLPQIEFQGFVSKPMHGQGKGAADKQYISINRRPCSLSKVWLCCQEALQSPH